MSSSRIIATFTVCQFSYVDIHFLHSTPPYTSVARLLLSQNGTSCMSIPSPASSSLLTVYLRTLTSHEPHRSNTSPLYTNAPFTALQLHLYLYPSHCSVMFLRLCRMSTAIQNRHILCVRFLTVFSFINSDDVFKNVDGVSQVLPLVRSFISTLRPRADALSSILIIVTHHYLHTHLLLVPLQRRPYSLQHIRHPSPLTTPSY
jgi:hypothetical protein